MATIKLDRLVKRYGQATVVHGIDLSIQDGEFVVLVGPSGCGKSTTLRMIAGLEEISGGEIRIDGRVVNDLQPKDRNIAMVFQNYAIYPHMTVADNIAFGLYRSKLSKSEKRQRVEQVAGTLGLSQLLDRRPSALSGGQRQRVAIGRAMVRDPAAFLFDEPLSNLDAQLRTQMRIEIKRLHHRLGTTSVFVTHDQVEAMTMADRIVVMRDGRILQVGTPLELYERPVDIFTARFIGSPTMNLLPASLKEGRADLSGGSSVKIPSLSSSSSEILIGVRPQDLALGLSTGMPGFSISGTVVVVEPLGSETLVHIESSDQTVIGSAPGRQIPKIGEPMTLHAPAERLYYFDKVTEKALAAQ
ncbi:ABC transporter ATP-binding protein [Microvirga guangxiensis]|uniref:Multiple sugar transport system ATP-binding protein n=1 Tax=Microvirga guangxiensis TaxID=549386 RepID=A0A1G5L054_9HYPH|nr:sn-glycerol-3-phosphate ABC transporter ATP-binding protein UgpC [Microvirga guangxiensis]SCZ06333.1 multiple sugar transport system ATP-binding protein [Microvirga guangxiensis]